MWHCEACRYYNEELDNTCARCGAEHVSAADLQRPGASAASPAPEPEAKRLTASGPAASTVSPASAGSPANVRRLAALALPLLSLLLALVLLALAAYIAWTRGLLGGWPSSGAETAKPAQAVTQAGGTHSSSALQPDSGTQPPPPGEDRRSSQQGREDPLAALDSAGKPVPAWVKDAKTYLVDLDQQLGAFAFHSEAPAELSSSATAALDQLKLIAEQLAQEYAHFESRASTPGEAESSAMADVLRRAFVHRMVALVRVIGMARATDSSGTHPAYMVPDTLAAALDAVAKADSAPIRAAWAEALIVHEEGSRNAKYGGQLAELSQRYDTLVALHREYAAKFKASPPYSLRNGILGNTASNLLQTYDALATSIEEQVLGLQSYTASLDPNTISKRMEAVISEFTDLAQQDHLYCFTETYKIYAKDRELSHPAYEKLKQHFEFAKTNWPGHRDKYVGVYTQYEMEWDQRWNPH